eukprot:CAMPEP_0114583400 /NCGR_PEP_ID=MMETSP0125-20121206/7137_1 /TAXON_ID=485358 ORGANISM="Aristerostoma sp., Strain ATCC 50986" /NCGR_SAMPLE_ID=MMETSP0125 /ASSEMBLY_ACC=CAM_ASM_000245 /LENGTH=486 /DNA_ID=CAMNT_0001776827 /DNA_START=228 /DNA_END=1688 /DNA_ORIENTATION=+
MAKAKPLWKKMWKSFTVYVLLICLLVVQGNTIFLGMEKKCSYPSESHCMFRFVGPHIRGDWPIGIFAASACLSAAIVLIYRVKEISNWFILLVFADIKAMTQNWQLDFFHYDALFNLSLLGFVAIEMVILIAAKLISMSYAKNAKGTILCLISSVIFGSLYFYFSRVYGACDHYSEGVFGNNKIDYQNEEYCKITEPVSCPVDILDGILDMTSLLFISCENNYGSFDKLKERFDGTNHDYIALPRVENMTEEQRLDSNLYMSVFLNSVPFNDSSEIKNSDKEIFLDLRNKQRPQYIIDVKRNETLVKERRAMLNPDRLTDNILVLYTDAISRAHSKRKLSKTLKWFQEKYDKPDSDWELFEFFRYHVVEGRTLESMFEMIFGIPWPEDEEVKDKYAHLPLVDTFKKNGYITGHYLDKCGVIQFHSSQNQLKKAYAEPWDHEGVAMNCDPNYQDPKSPYSIVQGPSAVFRRCFYGKDAHDYGLEYGT